METQRKTIINIADLLPSIISSRDVVNILIKNIKKTKTKLVDLDFSKIDFISRSAAHSFLLMKEDIQRVEFNKKEIHFINANKEVSEMFRVVAANRAFPKQNKIIFNPQRININNFLKKC